MSDYERFRREGWVRITPDDPDFLALVDRCARWATKTATTAERRDRTFTLESGAFNHFLNPHQKNADFLRLLESPFLRRVLTELLPGKSLFATHSKISYKFSGEQQEWLPHQDSGYKVKTCVGATLAVYLEDCGPENGPIQVFPRSHVQGRLPHRRILRPGDNNLQAVVRDLPAMEPVAATARKGDILVFDIDTIHQSAPNTGSGSRSVFIFEVQEISYTTIEFNGAIAPVLTGHRTAMQTALSHALAPANRALTIAKRVAGRSYKQARDMLAN